MNQAMSRDLKLVDGYLSSQLADGLLANRDPYELAVYAAETEWLAKLSPRIPSLMQRGNVMARARNACLLLEFTDTDVLIDPGAGSLIENANPSAILVTHAHHDHVGDLIAAAQLYPQAAVLMTPETFELLQMLPAETAYAIAQIVEQRGHLIAADTTPHRIFDVEYRFRPAGHLVGAAMIDIQAGDSRVLVTGDFALRELAGLSGAVWPTDAYDVVIMESSHAQDRDFPTADSVTNRNSVLSACYRAAADGAARLFVAVTSLGEAQEAYMALCAAQMEGAFPDFTVRFAGKAGQVAKLYKKLLSTPDSPWQNLIHEIVSADYIPDHSIVIAGGFERNDGVGAKLMTSLAGAGDTAMIMPTLDHSNSKVGYAYSISLHASFGELFATAAAMNCRQVALYHGPQGVGEVVSPLAKLLRRIGRDVVHLADSPKRLGGAL